MNVLLVSQCNKQALKETRRVLDQFAERKGIRTWQTAITLEGLKTLRKLLRRKARRNTAVACHWLKSGNRSELLWIVGNLRKFNELGTIPTNVTENDVLRLKDEDTWQTAASISLLAGIAGLFHDFGKANILFQKKLKSCKVQQEPFRHEWVSLRLFEAFVVLCGSVDRAWLEQLATISTGLEPRILEVLHCDAKELGPNPFGQLPNLAKAVSWLILTHHRLPKRHRDDDNKTRSPLEVIDRVGDLLSYAIDASWNSPQCRDEIWKKGDWQQVWQFNGTPYGSTTWCAKARSLAKRALKHPRLLEDDWLSDRFTCHVARMCLMLSDHTYSSGSPVIKWQDPKSKAFANTDRKSGSLRQKLDEHNIGVGQNAYLVAKGLPRIRHSLPSITRHKAFKQRSKDRRFGWQNKAYELAASIRERSHDQGFFGVNMASTGCGKTLANARIIYGLASEKLGCRFNVALGLRTLTLQTGDALQARLGLDSDDLAVLIGSSAVSDLHAYHRNTEHFEDPLIGAEMSGSESARDLFPDMHYIRYDGSLDKGLLRHWLQHSRKAYLYKLVSAPILVSTIDYLVPATEAERGGHQIAPMLRLLTSDLVLDEPDDFDLDDLPALCRLVNWAGMLGTRVLISSATLPLDLVAALFDAYAHGRREYNRACIDPSVPTAICCAWFDESSVSQSDHKDRSGFETAHQAFVSRRIANLARPAKMARVWDVDPVGTTKIDHLNALANSIQKGILELHADHHEIHPTTGKQISIGLIRMANINPLVAVSKRVLASAPPSGIRVHFCVYHSQYPLFVRSFLEKMLDRTLDRHDPEQFWTAPSVANIIESYPENHHILVVFATAVAEVGRDHCYDWAIVEPSSMRSIIQLAGRVLRHRFKTITSPNVFLLRRNYRALCGNEIAFQKPGFEARGRSLVSKDLVECLDSSQYQWVWATPRLLPRIGGDPTRNLVDLEHAQLSAWLFGDPRVPIRASLWWEHNPTTCFEMQRKTPFRRSHAKRDRFFLYLEDETDSPRFHQFDASGGVMLCEKRFKHDEIGFGDRVQHWESRYMAETLMTLAEDHDLSLHEASLRFGTFDLDAHSEDQQWNYHPYMGVFRTID